MWKVRRRLGWVVLTAICVALSAEQARAGSDPSDVLELRFEWPSPLALRVERSFERRDMIDDPVGKVTAASVVRSVWRGSQADGEYRIAADDFEVVQAEKPPSSQDPALHVAHVYRVASAEPPTLFVDATGKPLRFEELPGFPERLAAQYAAIPGLDADPGLSFRVELSMRPRDLERRAYGPWYFIAEIWHGRRVEVGKPWQVEQAGGGKDPKPTLHTYLPERRIPCAAADAAPACLRLVMRWAAPVRDGRTAMARGFELVRGRDVPPTARVESDGTITLDTHPETLVPVRYVYERRFAVSWTDAAGTPRLAGWSERTVHDFTRVEPPALGDLKP